MTTHAQVTVHRGKLELRDERTPRRRVIERRVILQTARWLNRAHTLRRRVLDQEQSVPCKQLSRQSGRATGCKHGHFGLRYRLAVRTKHTVRETSPEDRRGAIRRKVRR